MWVVVNMSIPAYCKTLTEFTIEPLRPPLIWRNTWSAAELRSISRRKHFCPVSRSQSLIHKRQNIFDGRNLCAVPLFFTMAASIVLIFVGNTDQHRKHTNRVGTAQFVAATIT